MTAPPRPSSPCVRHCVLDAATGLCEGCGRTLDEIAGWSRLDEDERQSIMARLAERMRRAQRPGVA